MMIYHGTKETTKLLLVKTHPKISIFHFPPPQLFSNRQAALAVLVPSLFEVEQPKVAKTRERATNKKQRRKKTPRITVVEPSHLNQKKVILSQLLVDLASKFGVNIYNKIERFK